MGKIKIPRHKTDQNCVIGDGEEHEEVRKRKETEEKKNGPMMGTFLNSKEDGGEEQGGGLPKLNFWKYFEKKTETKSL